MRARLMLGATVAAATVVAAVYGFDLSASARASDPVVAWIALCGIPVSAVVCIMAGALGARMVRKTSIHAVDQGTSSNDFLGEAAYRCSLLAAACSLLGVAYGAGWLWVIARVDQRGGNAIDWHSAGLLALPHLLGSVFAAVLPWESEDDGHAPGYSVSNIARGLFALVHAAILGGAALAAGAAAGVPDLTSGEVTKFGLSLFSLPAIILVAGAFACILSSWLLRLQLGRLASEAPSAVPPLAAYAPHAAVALVGLMACGFVLHDNPGAFAAGLAWWRPATAIGLGIIASIVASLARRLNKVSPTDLSPFEPIQQAALQLLFLGLAAAASFAVCGVDGNSALGLFGISLAAAGAVATALPSHAHSCVRGLSLPCEAAAVTQGTSGAVAHRLLSVGRGGEAMSRDALGAVRLTLSLAAVVVTLCLPALVQSRLIREASLHSAAQPVRPNRGPVAIVHSHRRFTVIVPGAGLPSESGDPTDFVAAALLVDLTQFDDADDYGHLQIGTVLPVEPVGADDPSDARRFRVKGHIAHGDHSHDLDFTISAVDRMPAMQTLAVLGGLLPALAGLMFGAAGGLLARYYHWAQAWRTGAHMLIVLCASEQTLAAIVGGVPCLLGFVGGLLASTPLALCVQAPAGTVKPGNALLHPRPDDRFDRLSLLPMLAAAWAVVLVGVTLRVGWAGAWTFPE